MARLTDVVVSYENDMSEVVAYHHPNQALRIGAQIIVGPAQQAIFVRDGKPLDVFGPGRHTVSTMNIPLLTNLLSNLVFGGDTPFQASIFYLSTREFPQLRWGTSQPIALQTPGIGLGWLLAGAHGTFGIRLTDPVNFVNQFVGFIGPGQAYTIDQLRERMINTMTQSLTDLLAEQAPGSIQKAQAMMNEMSAAVQARVQDDFAAMGFMLTFFRFGGLSPLETSAEKLRQMGLLDIGTYSQMQQADAIRAAGEKGVDNLVGIGAVLGGQGLNRGGGIPIVQGGQPQQAGQPQATATPDVMTTMQAAAYMQVTEQDVIAAIDAGQLKAKKVGNQYRVSKKAIDDFLAS